MGNDLVGDTAGITAYSGRIERDAATIAGGANASTRDRSSAARPPALPARRSRLLCNA
jgi:hypothetical protein